MKKNNYIELTIAIFLSVLAFFLLLIVIYFILKYFIAGVNMIPGVLNAFTFSILSLPAFILFSVYAIFFRRTRLHTSAVVRMISWGLLGLALAAIAIVYTMDCITFFSTGNPEVTDYHCYSRYFMVPGISLLFGIATLQALSTEKEKDWMERNSAKTDIQQQDYQ